MYMENELHGLFALTFLRFFCCKSFWNLIMVSLAKGHLTTWKHATLKGSLDYVHKKYLCQGEADTWITV
jgi:hypothetical protein